MELLIKNARVVDSCLDFMGDVYIKDGIIHEIGRDIDKDCNIVNGRGHMLLPSFVDLHAHFRDPGLNMKEDILSGSMAAVKGGYTAVNLMANTKPVCDSMEVVEYVLKKAGEAGLLDIHQSVSITRGLEGEDISHLDSLDNRVKFLSDDGRGVLSDRVMYHAMKKAYSLGKTIISHAENGEITPEDTRLSENIMTVRDIALSEHTGCSLHMAHVSTMEAMRDIIEAKKRDVHVTCEVTPHHIALDDETSCRVNPPLREKADVEYLIKAIKCGLVDTISTDHAPHTLEDKKNGAPGLSGIETSFSVCYSSLVLGGHISINRLCALMSQNPARIMGLNKGMIGIGCDGDLVLVDANKKYKVTPEDFLSKGKNTPFEGMTLYGQIEMTIKGGKIVYKRGEGFDYR